MEKMLEAKLWDEYSKNEKKILLQHWWHYYVKMVYTSDELEQFNQLLEEDCDTVYLIAVLGYSKNISSQILINAMRNNKVPGLLKIISDITESQNEEVKEILEITSANFISEIVSTYNRPAPAAPMSPEELSEQIIDIVNQHGRN